MGDVSQAAKMLVLALLVLQNATQTLLMRYSRGVLHETYNTMVTVVLTECTKFTVCALIIAFNLGPSALNGSTYSSIWSKLFYLLRHSGYTWVPATCYFIQNILQYTASENLSSSVYAVLQQMKILTAALASVAILHKQLMWRQWRALLLLIAGGLLMEYHTFALNKEGTLSNVDPVKGSLALLAIVCISGFAGVFTELLLKNKSLHKSSNTPTPHNESTAPVITNLSIWDRNIQISAWSVVFGLVSLAFSALFSANDESASQTSLFDGFSTLTVLLILVWTAGGLLVALTIKYTDVIIKGFASAISLILICIGGAVLLNDYLDLVFMIGATVTVIATFNYSDRELPPQAQMQTSISRIERADDLIARTSNSEMKPLKDKDTDEENL